jgi:hypothetical protein
MHNQDDDILLIRKYLDGELDAKAMHDLERRALDDPFLMDAIEGYGIAEGYCAEDIETIADRLKKRIAGRSARVITMRWVGIAASLLIVGSAGLWWYYNGQKSHEPVSPQHQVAAQLPPALPNPQKDSDISSRHARPISKSFEKKVHVSSPRHNFIAQNPPPVVAADKLAIKPPSVASTQPKEPAKADSTPMDEMIVMQYSARKQVDTSLFVKKAKVHSVGNPPAQLLQSQAPGVNIYSNDESRTEHSKLVTQGVIPLSKQMPPDIIVGRVISKDDGQPVNGASVNVAGTNKSTQTDAQGRFAIKADSNHNDLLVAGIGYKTKRVAANGRDSVKNITLDSQSAALAEVVVTGYTSSADSDKTTADVVAAHPVQGWGNYRGYLKKNAILPGSAGVVKLTFMVDKFGSVSSITVTKSLNPAADKKAIDMVKYGPAWSGSSDRKPQKIRLRIRFSN